jgi:predicted nucleic acid-binding protein
MSVLVDTNVLPRRTQPDHPDYSVAVRCIAALLEIGETICVTLQNISEFWNVATRPAANNGIGLSVGATLAQVTLFEQLFTLLPQTPAQYDTWKQLVIKHQVPGSKVHDAKLVAIMRAYGIWRILTFNAGDFARHDVEALHPAAVAESRRPTDR